MTRYAIDVPTALRLVRELGWDDTVPAEYVAVAKLQADALVTANPAFAREVGGVVRIAPFEALLS
jgi:hypothetical protein